MPLSPKEQNLFQQKIDRFNDSLAWENILLYEDFSCCQSCGHHEMEGELIEGGYDVETTSYLFYHTQEGKRLREGADEVYLAHDIKEKDVKTVMEIVKGYGGSWDGSGNTTICIPFIDFTPEKLKELEEEALIRVKRINLIKKLKEEGATEEVIDEWLEKAEFRFNVPEVDAH
jgi:hypothetical protein